MTYTERCSLQEHNYTCPGYFMASIVYKNRSSLGCNHNVCASDLMCHSETVVRKPCLHYLMARHRLAMNHPLRTDSPMSHQPACPTGSHSSLSTCHRETIQGSIDQSPVQPN